MALSPQVTKLVWNFVLAPSAQTWDAIYNVVVAKAPSGRILTIWEVYCVYDPLYPREKSLEANSYEERWPLVPNRFILARSLKEAVQFNK